jgi:hypothetical protein
MPDTANLSVFTCPDRPRVSIYQISLPTLHIFDDMANQALNGRTYTRDEDIGIEFVVTAANPTQDMRDVEVFLVVEDATSTPATYLFTKDNTTGGNGGITVSESTSRRSIFRAIITPDELSTLTDSAQLKYSVWLKVDGIKNFYQTGTITSDPARSSAP